MFINQEKIYEIYAKKVNQSGLFGFVEVEGLIFGEKTLIRTDPEEERLKNEFAGVERTYIPLQSVIRIDQQEKKGVSKITPLEDKNGTVSNFSNSTLFAQHESTKKPESDD